MAKILVRYHPEPAREKKHPNQIETHDQDQFRRSQKRRDV